MRLLKPKNINRAIVALALLAPIAYLFGTQFSALSGAHGEEVLKEDNEIVLYDRSVNYAQVISTVPYNTTFRDVSFDFNNCVWHVYGNSTGFASISVGSARVVEGHRYYFANNISFAQSGSSQQMYITRNGSGWRYSATNNEFVADSNFIFEANFVVYSGVEADFYFNCYLFDITQMYGENGTLADLQADYDMAGTNYYSLSRLDYFPVYGVPSYSESLFTNLFTSRNFLTNIGENAISDNPKGFAPFGHLMGFIDSNMLHIGDTPIGLLGYGYLYWCAHVLILDLICYFMTFFIRLIKSIVDKWEVSQW